MKTIKNEFAIYAITKDGIEIAKKLKENLKEQSDVYISYKFSENYPEATTFQLPMGPILSENFNQYYCHIFILSVGAVVRMIKDLIQDKKKDPAIICIDDKAKFSICLLSGHIGRGNYYTQKIANILNAIPVITTASDVKGTLTVDILGRELGWQLEDLEHNVTRGCAAVVNEEKVAIIQECGEPDFWPLDKPLPKNIYYFTRIEEVQPEQYSILLIITDREIQNDHPEYWEKGIIYRPKTLILGVGCDKDIPSDVFERGIFDFLKRHKLSFKSVKGIATIDKKQNEKAIIDFVNKYNLEFQVYPAEILDQVEGIENPSEVVKKYVGSRGVAEPACLLMAKAQKLLIPREKYKEDTCKQNMTIAAARIIYPNRNEVKNE
ncbi:MAG: cobalamin biosynthesis protein [Leptospiraceae bacterium]|nr:MAG: cobalamin biosynthesis protein [Leptospiraceae bacterium]